MGDVTLPTTAAKYSTVVAMFFYPLKRRKNCEKFALESEHESIAESVKTSSCVASPTTNKTSWSKNQARHIDMWTVRQQPQLVHIRIYRCRIQFTFVTLILLPSPFTRFAVSLCSRQQLFAVSSRFLLAFLWVDWMFSLSLAMFTHSALLSLAIDRRQWEKISLENCVVLHVHIRIVQTEDLFLLLLAMDCCRCCCATFSMSKMFWWPFI